MNKLWIAALFAVAGASAYGQAGSYNALFNPAGQVTSFTDVFVTASKTNTANDTYTVSVGSDPSIVVGGKTIYLAPTGTVFAFYLGDENSTGNLGATGSNLDISKQQDWIFEPGKGGTKKNPDQPYAGWYDKGHGTGGIDPGHSLTFTFNSLSDNDDFLYAFHFTYYKSGDSGATSTGYFWGQGNPGLPPGNPNSTPAPAALVPFGIGAIGLLRRRIKGA